LRWSKYRKEIAILGDSRRHYRESREEVNSISSSPETSGLTIYFTKKHKIRKIRKTGAHTMTNKRASELFFKYLKLSTSPVALKMCASEDELPARAKIPRKEWGVDFRACQAVHVARRYEVTVAIPRNEMPCPTGAVALGFYKPNDLYWSGACFFPSYQSLEAKKVAAKNKSRLEAQYEYVLITPLHKASFTPDLILIYGNPGQITRAIQAAVFNTGKPIRAKTVCATACSEWVSAAMITGECQYVFPCDGERRYGALDDSEMVFSLPYGKMGEILDSLKTAYNAKEGRIKYPAERFLFHQGPVSERYQKLLDSLRKTE
jgi:uncharacterized protein (DUF169 family)